MSRLYDFMHDPKMCGDQFSGASWDAWRVIARLYDGDSHLLSAEQQEIARKLIGREELPTEAPQELFVAAGRRSGKTRFDALLAVHAAAQDYRAKLAPGEWATISVHAVNREQAGNAFDFCCGLVERSAVLAAEVTSMTAGAIEFAHRSRIQIHTSSFRTIRGYNIALALIDEAAFLRSEFSALPDVELYNALTPALMTLNGRLVVTSSLHRKVGLMWTKYREYHAHDERPEAEPAPAPIPQESEPERPQIADGAPSGCMTMEQFARRAHGVYAGPPPPWGSK